jgi:hypothetical protein
MKLPVFRDQMKKLWRSNFEIITKTAPFCYCIKTLFPIF